MQPKPSEITSQTHRPEKNGSSGESHNLSKDNDKDVNVEAEKNPEKSSTDSPDRSYNRSVSYMKGTRFFLASGLLGLNFFLVSMELSVAATSLVRISDDIGGFEDVSWILSSYLLGYVAVIIIFSKLSDIFGRKPLLIICISIFTIFSGACGAAQNMTQLIILRAFQGVGGGACFAINLIFMSEMVPASKYAKFAAYMGIPSVLAMGLGPLIGGGFVSSTTWRWVFLVNVPFGAISLILAIFAIPNGFPYHDQPRDNIREQRRVFSKATLSMIDIQGSVLLFLATLSLTAGFSEADSRFAWNSAYVITLLTVSVVLWTIFLLWERHVTISNGTREPVLPWRFLTDRVLVGMLLGSIALGGPITASLYVLPSRFQLVNGLSGLAAGVRLLPFALSASAGAILGSTLGGRLRIPVMYIALGGSLLQVVGLTLLSTLPPTPSIPAKTYGFQVLAGVGGGLTYQTFYVTMPFVVGRQDAAVGLGAVTQFRMMGGAVILAIAASIFNGHVLPVLKDFGVEGIEGMERLGKFRTTKELEIIRETISEGYNRQMVVLAVSAGVQALAVLMMWKRVQIRLPSVSNA